MLNTILDHKTHATGFLAVIATGQLVMRADQPLVIEGTIIAIMLAIFFGTYASLIKRMHGEWKEHDRQMASDIDGGAAFPKFNLLNVVCLWTPLVFAVAATPVIFSLMK